MVETWKPVVGYEGSYLVSDLGNVRSLLRRGRTMKRMLNKHGYWAVMLYRRGTVPRYVSVHRLVAEAFIGPIRNGFEVNHIDGIRTNAALTNIELVTRSENIRHAFQVLGKKAPQGEHHGRSKLTENEARSIKNSSAKGRDLAKMFNTSEATVSEIRRGHIWRHV